MKSFFYLIIGLALLHQIIATELSVRVDNDALAQQYHDIGMKAAMEKNMEEAVAYLRAACRLKPKDPYLWNDLGVTEMRMGLMEKAMRRYQKALEINKYYQVATNNVNDLRSYLSPDDFRRFSSKGKKQRQQHQFLEIKSYDPYDDAFINTDDINKVNYDVLLEPFVVKQALQNWGWNLTALNLNDLADENADVIVDYYPHNMVDENVRPFRTPFSLGINQLTSPREIFRAVDASQPGSYVHWNMGQEEWDVLLSDLNGTLPAIFDDLYWTSECFDDYKYSEMYHLNTHWKMLLVGEAGAGMFNHKDALKSASFQLQLIGRKKWHLCAPDQDAYMYHAGQVDAFSPDYESFPLFKKASCYQFTLEPGDVIFYPKNYWHQTLNLKTPTVALTGTLVTPDNHNDVASMLNENCNGRGGIFTPDQEFCRQLVQCYALWHELFDETKVQKEECNAGNARGNCT